MAGWLIGWLMAGWTGWLSWSWLVGWAGCGTFGQAMLANMQQICGAGESGGGDGGNVGDGGCGGGDQGGIQRGHDRWCCRCGREDVVMVHVLSFAHAAQIVVRDASQRVRVAGFCCSQRCRARCCSACEARSPIACCGAAPVPASCQRVASILLF